jgi:hypothetical protein
MHKVPFQKKNSWVVTFQFLKSYCCDFSS